jgi:hypothetical protein
MRARFRMKLKLSLTCILAAGTWAVAGAALFNAPASAEQGARVGTNAVSRHGRVQLDGRALRDEAGAFPALGATLFWALWAERRDPDKLERNLAWLADGGVDYVRILGMVGGEGWEDRRIDPGDADYWPTVDRFLERLARHRLRVQVTLFAAAGEMMPKSDQRERFVDRWAARASRDPSRFLLLEVANEHWQNGVGDIAELRSLGRRLSRQTDVLVALSAPRSEQVCAVYVGSGADVATVHYSRSFADDDPWRPVRQPWTWPLDEARACAARLPPIVNNEPIGPQSSANEDDDPRRLVMSYVTTFVAGNAAYVVHTGAGVRGGGAADRALGRAANVWETPNLTETLAGIRRLRAILPVDLPNWRRFAAGDSGHPFAGFGRAFESGSLAASYAATRGDRFVAVALGVQGAAELMARKACTVEVRDPLSGAIVARHDLAGGQRFTLSGADAFVVTGRFR